MSLANKVPARDIGYGVVQFIRKRLTFEDNGKAVVVGTVPAGALILKALSGAHVNVVTNAGTNNLMNIGTTADDDLYGTSLSTAAIAFVPLDEAVSMYASSDTTVTATLALTGTAATTGDIEVVIAFVTGGR
jgi:hypothetical protein